MIKAILTDLKVSLPCELKTSASGKTYTSLLCSIYAGKDKDGKSKYINIRLSMFGKTAERAAELQKGNLINAVVSVTDLTSYMRKDGNQSLTLEATADTFEKPLGERSHDQAPANSYSQQANQMAAQQANQWDEPADEGLPF